MAEEAEGGAPQRQRRPLRSSQCRGVMRKALTEGYEEIVKGFVEQAKTGSAAHVRLANELLAAPVRKKRLGESSVEAMIRKLDRD